MVEASISSNRVSDAAMRLFSGRGVADVPPLVPSLFSVCGIAQGIASVRACGGAMGIERGGAVDVARDMLLLAETAREHLWRVLLDWPGWIGEGDFEGAGDFGRLPADYRRALFGARNPFVLEAEPLPDYAALDSMAARFEALLCSRVFGMTTAGWLELGATGFDSWMASAATGPARVFRWLRAGELFDLGAGAPPSPLPAIPDALLEAHMRGDRGADFVARPDWQGVCRETGVFTRQFSHPLLEVLIRRHGAGLLPRLVARLIELATLPARMLDLRQRLENTKPGMMNCESESRGMACVEAARGRLIHFVEIDGRVVANYRILAPTEWNFHPRGVAAKGLEGLGEGDDSTLRRRAILWIGAVDPCVEYELELV